MIQDEQLATGSGRTKQDAEKEAASKALERFHQRGEQISDPEQDD